MVARQRVFGIPEANRGDGAGPGGVLRVQVAFSVISKLWAMVLSGAGLGIQPLSTDVSLMTWQAMWTRNTSLWACAA